MKVGAYSAHSVADRLFTRNGIEGLIALDKKVENSDIFGLEVFVRHSARGTMSK